MASTTNMMCVFDLKALWVNKFKHILDFPGNLGKKHVDTHVSRLSSWLQVLKNL